MRGREISKIRFLGQFLTLNNMVLKFFQNSNFSYFLGIKSEIHQWDYTKYLKCKVLVQNSSKLMSRESRGGALEFIGDISTLWRR